MWAAMAVTTLLLVSALLFSLAMIQLDAAWAAAAGAENVQATRLTAPVVKESQSLTTTLSRSGPSVAEEYQGPSSSLLPIFVDLQADALT